MAKVVSVERKRSEAYKDKKRRNKDQNMKSALTLWANWEAARDDGIAGIIIFFI